MLKWDKDFIPFKKNRETYFKISSKIGWKTIVQKKYFLKGSTEFRIYFFKMRTLQSTFPQYRNI